MKSTKRFSLLAVLPLCLLTPGFSQALNAATLHYHDSQLNTPLWATAGYGQEAYFFFAVSTTSTNSNNIMTSLLSGGANRADFKNPSNPDSSQVYVTNNNYSYVSIERPDRSGTVGAGVLIDTGITATPVALVDFSFHETAASSYRVGVMVGGNDGAPPARLVLTVGSASAEVNPVVPSPAQPRADWYFFDVTGLAPTDTLRISANWHADVSGKRYGSINGVVFDAIPAIPEPSSVALAGVLLGGALLGRRRLLKK